MNSSATIMKILFPLSKLASQRTSVILISIYNSHRLMKLNHFGCATTSSIACIFENESKFKAFSGVTKILLPLLSNKTTSQATQEEKHDLLSKEMAGHQKLWFFFVFFNLHGSFSFYFLNPFIPDTID